VQEEEEQHLDLTGEDTRRVTIRAKLYAAMVMTVLGPVITIGVAFAAFSSLSDRFDEVSARSGRQALALEIKFAVTDVNGWQTAYGYDDGRSRPQFARSAQNVRQLLATAQRQLTEPRERGVLARLSDSFGRFMGLDAVAYRALRAGEKGRVRQLFLGPEIGNFEAMASAAGQLAAEEARRNAEVERRFDRRLTDAKRALVIVGLGAGVLIVLLLVTASDIARLALERRAEREP
jgi:methyl-accepting chemotaxis protein